MPPHDVFISYARDTSRDHAEALHQALGGRTAFLDTEAIPIGEKFQEAVVDALFDARVVVIFAEPRYFTRWYCLLEFRIARTPFLRTVERADASPREKEDALRGLIVAMPPHGVDPMMERFPPLVRARNWPKVDDIEAIAALVEAELTENPPTLRERYAKVADAEAMRSYVLQASHLPPPRRIGSVPFVPQVGLPTSIGEAFVGRADDLWRIHDLLWTDRGDPATAAGLTGAIEATGGFGKTRLALEYLYRFGPAHFAGGLFWINAESDPELQLYDVLQALSPSTPAIEAIRQVPGGVPGALARAIRSRSDDAPTPLFIIDNVPEPHPDERPKPLETWCPVLGEVPVLTTSRTQVALGAGGRVVAVPIETLDPESAVQLLTTEVPRASLTDDEWKEIAEWVGHLPLALEILNKLLRSGEIEPRALLELSREERPSAAVDAAMESIRSVVPEGALRGVTEAFSASYNLLTPEEQYAVRLLAWMASAPIPNFVIDTLGPEIFAPGVRAKLRNRSFVTEVRDGSGAFFGSMHRVLADFILAQAESSEEEVGVVAAFLTRVMESAEGRGAEGSARVRECAPLALSLVTNWITRSITENGFSRASYFATQSGDTLGRWGYPAHAGALFASVASASGRLLGDEHVNTLGALNNLAGTYRNRGDLAGAQKLQERVLEVMRRTLGDEDSRTLSAMNNLALSQRDSGDYEGAQELQERVLNAWRHSLGKEHLDTLLAMNNLALTLRIRGDHPGAQELQEQVLEARRRILGHDHLDTLNAMNNLGITLRAGGAHTEARELQERVLEIRLRILGNEHPDTIAAMGNLAITLNEQGEHDKAQELFEHVLTARRQILGLDHPDTLSAMNNLAVTRGVRGDYAGVQEQQESVLEARQRIFGREHPDTLTAMSNLAITLRAQGNLAGAQELQRRVVESMQRTLGVEHPWTTVAAWGLLQIYIDVDDADSADGLLRTVLLWLLDRDPAFLTGQQRYIRDGVRSMLENKFSSSADQE